MAKKKSKKNNQKQVEVAAPPDSPKPTAVPTVEESPANEATPDAQQQSLAPPEAAGDELPETGSTSVPERTPGDIQDKPGEDETPIDAGSSKSGEMTSPVESGHVQATSAPSEETATVSGAELQDQTPAEEEDTHRIAADHPKQPHFASNDITAAASNSTSAEEAIAPVESNAVQGDESQLDSGREPTPLTLPEDSTQAAVQTSDVPEMSVNAQHSHDMDQTNAEAPISIETREELPNAEMTTAMEPTMAEPEQSNW